MARRPKPQVLKPVRPNLGIQQEYRRRLFCLIDAMAASYEYFLKAQYRKTPPRMAQDDSPAKELQRELRRLGARWEKRFNAASPELARWFARRARTRSEAVLAKILRDAGISIQFQMPRSIRDVMNAIVAENVALIKSIPEEYHYQVQGMVMRSVAVGGDLSLLTKDLQRRYGISRRRAELIARDQNNKATAVIVRARQIEVGIKQALWLHSHGGKKPRKTHFANDRKPYDVEKGWFDPDPKVRRRIFPGELINCRCVSKSIVPGFPR